MAILSFVVGVLAGTLTAHAPRCWSCSGRPRSTPPDPEANGAGGAVRGRHVLAIDDNPEILAISREVLAEPGYRVSCLSVRDADLGVLKGLAPDLVLLDYGPRERGRGWPPLQRLTHDPEAAALPVIVCSGAAAARRMREPGSPGGVSGVAVEAKPVDLDAPESEVRRRFAGADERRP